MSVEDGDNRVKQVIVDARINKVLSMRTDSVVMLESLNSISDFFGKNGNTPEARRALRHDVELQNIILAKKFLKEFDAVRMRIDRVDDHTTRLEQACSAIATRVTEANENMNQFMKNATDLETKRNACALQSKEIDNFLQRYELSNEEIKILREAAIDNPKTSRKFFDALAKLRISYKECKEMVEKHRQSVGFELLELLVSHQDVAYQRLFEWVKVKCDGLENVNTSSDDIDTSLQLAIQFLKDFPVYYTQCQELIATAQRTKLVQRFVVALTHGGGGSAGSSFRAIEMHSHDAIRYIGDMLAWTHQTVASEEEFLHAFFPSNNKNHSDKKKSSYKLNSVDQNGVHNTNLNTKESNNTEQDDNKIYTVEELLVRCLQGLGSPLKVRILQTLEARSQSIEILYTLLDLLVFYEETFAKLLNGSENAVHITVCECLTECKKFFLMALSKQSEVMLQSASSMHPTDLGPSYNSKECARQIREILKSQKNALSSYASRNVSDDSDEAKFQLVNVLGAVIRPLLQACRVGSQALSSADMAIYIVNNVSIIQQEFKDASEHDGLMPPSSAVALSQWQNQLNQESGMWIEVLVREETGRIFSRSDLDKLFELFEVLPEGLVASTQPGLSQDRVGTILRAFYASLFSTLSSTQFEKIIDPEIREATRKNSAEVVAAGHEKVHIAVSNTVNGYDQSVLTHSIDEVRVLLGSS